MLDLSEKSVRLIELLFNEADVIDMVSNRLKTECGSNIPFCESYSAEDMERIRFAVLKLSESNINKLDNALDLAKIDWRDLLMAADFGHDTQAHNKWYKQLLHE